MRHVFDPSKYVMAQLRAIGLPENLPRDRYMLYRFFGADDRLLYVGITCAPCSRWNSHRRKVRWWPLVSAVSVEWHPYLNAARDAETLAIKAEHPEFNILSAAPIFSTSSVVPPKLLMRNVPLSLSMSRSLSKRLRTKSKPCVSNWAASRRGDWTWLR